MTAGVSKHFAFGEHSLAINPYLRRRAVGKASVVRSVAVVLVWTAPIPVSGQDVVIISDSVTCRSCRIELVRSLTILSRTGRWWEFWRSPAVGGVGHGNFSLPTPILSIGRGTVIVVDRAPTGGVLVFDSSGRFLRKLYELPGLPTERLRHAAVAAGPDGSLEILSGQHTGNEPNADGSRRIFGGQRVTLNTRQQFIRASPLPHDLEPRSAVVLESGQLVVEGVIKTRDLVGYPLHVLGPDGTRERSLGAFGAESYTGNIWLDRRIIAPARANSAVWSARINEYAIEAWGMNGSRLARIERASGWFRPWFAYTGRPDLTRPPPRIAALREDANGRLWTLTLVPSQDWKPLGRKGEGESGALTITQLEELTDAVVEVIDPKRGVLLASTRLKGLFEGFVGSDYIAQLSAPPGGTTTVTLWRIGIVQNEEER